MTTNTGDETMNTTREATLIKYRWDAQAGVEPGWYCESYNEAGEMIDDSQKVWWPIDVDQYETEPELVAALHRAFPDAAVEPW